jgi:hypothetical protein
MNTIFLSTALTDEQINAILAVVRDHNNAFPSARLRFSENFEESISGEFYFEGPAENAPETIASTCYTIARICAA